MAPQDDRRTRLWNTLKLRGLPWSLSPAETTQTLAQQRFSARAKALFYARMMFLLLGLCMLAVPVWRSYFNFTLVAVAGFVFMLMYSVANYFVLGHRVAGAVVTYITLCFDLLVMVVIIIKPHSGGGLANPLLATQLLFTMLFALLFPKPLAIVPPLLVLPITARIDQLLNRNPTEIEILTLIWYLGLNFIVIYVLVYLNEQESTAQREVVHLQSELRELAVLEERSRIAREIHDGLGANLSSLIIQAEYLTHLDDSTQMKRELQELKESAEEAIEELRRSLQMMRPDFDLAQGLEDYVSTIRARTQLPVTFSKQGTLATPVSPEASLALFRVLQELLSNAAKHAQASRIEVSLRTDDHRVTLRVTDNGRGFDTQTTHPGHYGLANIHERALQLGGEVSLQSRLHQGTDVVFQLPLSPLLASVT